MNAIMHNQKLFTVQNRVEKILETVPDARSNDRLLLEIYMVSYHGVTTLKQYRQSGKEVPTFESIRRCRQKIQADGRYLAVDKVVDGRNEKEAEYFKYSKS